MVDFVAADRMAQLGKMDADLMGAARLQPAFDQRVIAQKFQGPDVRYRGLADVGQGRAAAAAVAPIADQAVGDRLGLDPARHHRQIAAMRGMLAKLLRQELLGLAGPGEDDQAAGVAVQPMHRAERRGNAARGGGLCRLPP